VATDAEGTTAEGTTAEATEATHPVVTDLATTGHHHRRRFAYRSYRASASLALGTSRALTC
jgi:hypothetical protein